MIDLICICCPEGCRLQVDPANDCRVTGNRCPRGETYGKEEVLSPTRMVTSTVRLLGKALSRLPVKTNEPVPKSMIRDVMLALNNVTVTPPVHAGDVVLDALPGTDAVIVATRTVRA